MTHQDRPEDEPLPIDVDPGRDQTEYELDDWSREGRQLLERVLVASELPHAWQGALLVVRRADEEQVDMLIDEVQVATLPTLTPDGERVVYEVAEWIDEAKYRLADALDEAGLAWEWDGMGDLVIDAVDEAAADALIDGLDIEQAETETEPSGADGLAAADVLNDLFVAADRLRRNARDHQGVLALVDRMGDLEALGLPYGFEREAWDALVAEGLDLLTLFESDEEVDDDLINERAAAYRQALHRFV